ncbi:MAG: VCBS repeat-containing protein [Terriglobales bacterium]
MKALGTFPPIRALFTIVLVLSTATAAWAQPAATTTALSITPNSLAPDTAVTLTATVTSTTPGTITGQVLFCNASAKYCEGSGLIGSAWVITSGTALGTATIHKTFGPGTYNIQSVFAGTNTYFTSTSAASNLAVSSGPLPTTTTISAIGVAGNYALNGTVWAGGTAVPTGSVSFQDATTNTLLGSGLLSSGVMTSGFAFTNTMGPATSSQSQAIAVGDFNNDGNLDYLVANMNSPATATVLLGNGNGTFTAVTQGGSPYSPPVGSIPEGAVVADFNGDGNLDLAFANSAGSGIGASDGVTVLLGNGDGTFTAAASPTVSYGAAIAVGDFNGDGIPDLAVSNNASNVYVVTILLGNGDGTFNVGDSISVPQWSINPQGIVAMDFNGDGKIDLAVTSANINSPQSDVVTILLGNGDGTFMHGQTYTTGERDQSLVGGDFNGDGMPDLAIANYDDNTVTILLGNGDGTFIAPTAPLPATGAGPFAIVAGDFNNDGNLDLATANFYDNTVTILLGSGDGTFTAASSTPGTGNGPDGIVVGDFNGDGLLDIVTPNYQATTQSILLQSTNSTTVTISGVTVPGTDNVFANYSGDTNYSSSQSSTVPLNSIVITLASQTITFPNPGPLPNGVAPVTLMATASSGLPLTYTLISGPGSLSGSTLTITGLGSIVVEADQAGNTDYLPAPSVRITIVVMAAEFTLIPQSSTPPTISAGQTANVPVNVNAASGFTGTVIFTCTVPSDMIEASCSANSVQVTGSAPVTAQVTVNTTGPHQVSGLSWPNLWNTMPFGIAFAAVLVASGPGRKKSKKGMLLVALTIVTLAILVSCGGSSASTKTDPGTAVGTYNLTLVGTSGSSNYTVTLPVTVD